MKLKRRRKLLSTKKNKLLFPFFIFIVFLLFPFAGYSQHFKFKFDSSPISTALIEVAKKTNIKIAFDSDDLNKITITKNINNENVKDVISTILENTGYDFTIKHNTYLIVKLKQNITVKERTDKIISGFVYDAETNERLPFASIFDFDKNASYSTNVEGNFSLSLKDSSFTKIRIKYLGYFSLDTLVKTNNIKYLYTFGLHKKTQNIQTVDITGEKLEMVDFNNDAGYLTINPVKFGDLPNYGETDIFRALQLMPGIGSFENSSQLNIRGGSSDQNLVMYDGFTLYNLDHFFGVFSALNPNVIKNIQVYRGGFDSRYGERVSGIVDITGKSGNNQKTEIYGGINLISANLTAEIPVSKKLTLVAAGRRAYSDIYSSWFADALLKDKLGQNRRLPIPDANTITPEFYFSDHNIKLTYSVNPMENISFSFYGAKDYLNSSNINTDDRGSFSTVDTNNWGNYGFGGSWKKQWKANYFTNLQLGHSGYFNDYYNNSIFIPINPPENQTDNLTEETNESNDLTDYFISFKNQYFLNPNNQLEYGISGRYNEFAFYKDATRNFIYDNLKSSAYLFTLFFQDKIKAGKSLTLKPGFRGNFYQRTTKFYFEPRFAASYKTSSGMIFKLATGRYYQFLNKSETEQSFGYNRDFWILANGSKTPVVSSNHFIIGTSYQTKNLYFNIEAYYKTVNGLQEYLFFQNPEEHIESSPIKTEFSGLSEFISGKGKAYGIDFLIKYETSNFNSWLAYSLSKAVRNFSEINNGEEIPSLYDQTHSIKWTNIYTYNKWNFSTLSVYTTGTPYIESSTKQDNFNTTRNYNRLPDYFRVDLSANYNFNIKNVNIKPGFSVLNAFNTQNYLDIYIRKYDFNSGQVNETTLVEAQKITLNFFINFRF